MCGRYSLTTAPEALRRLFDFTGPAPNLRPRYNVAPTQTMPVVRMKKAGAGRELVMMRWGLIPHWAKEAAFGYRTINARAETVARRPAFRSAFKRRRCLVPADGFYEWRELDRKKQPYRIGLKGGEPFAFAGLWERWTAAEDGKGFSEGDEVESYTIVVTQANEKLRPIHDRMPVILAPEDYEVWLSNGAHAEAAGKLLRPFPEAPMAYYRVSTRVNSPANDDPAVVEQLSDEPDR